MSKKPQETLYIQRINIQSGDNCADWVISLRILSGQALLYTKYWKCENSGNKY